jgi:molybdopterin-guanine dinucleotide biosynthesis protein A
MHKDDITGVVLAGGRGTRMGSVDKGLQLLNGQPLALHVAQRLLPQVGQLAINANQNLDHYREFGFPVWPDTLQGFHGPLAGLHTALSHCETPYLVSTPCDSPFVPLDLAARLALALEQHDAEAAVAATGASPPLQPQPVFCLLRTTLQPRLERCLIDGGRRVNEWLASLRVAQVHFEDEAAFRNINTAEDLRQFESR